MFRRGLVSPVNRLIPRVCGQQRTLLLVSTDLIDEIDAEGNKLNKEWSTDVAQNVIDQKLEVD